ncbi:MAG: SDR family oxidoreductase [Candidatus Cloacimonetes bacterium]|jgi:3-oxoacyl-[acyl-carrier protein] reductase|nr:SDR family oxidoreductase [Candidatus Cloacimonadota bacterium]
MDLGINGKIALVTAASKGLGKAVASQLASEGANVIICSRSLESLQKAKSDIFEKLNKDVTTISCDVTNEEQIKHMINSIIQDFGTIDILVTNAGGPPAGGFGDFNVEDYRKAVELNLLSTISLCKKAVPIMQKQKWGRIVMMTSVSVMQPIDNLILSNTARTAVIGFMKSLSNEVAKDGITVNSICPGYTKTQRVDKLAKAFTDRGKGTIEDFYKKLEADIPMKRIGTPFEFGQTVAFMVSEGAGYITGVSLKVDGGFAKGLF